MRRRRAAAFGLLVIAAVLAGCTGEEGGSAPTPTGSDPPPTPTVVASSRPAGEGPPPSWTLPVGENSVRAVSLIGDLAVLDMPEPGGFRVVQPSSGRLLWQRPIGRFMIAGNTVVVWNAKVKVDDRVEAVDLKTGRTLWRSQRPVEHVSVFRDVVYVDDCKKVAGLEPARDCATTRRDVRTGRPHWRLPHGPSDYTIGANPPIAPASGRYLPLYTGPGDRHWVAAEAATGRKLRGRLEFHISGPALVVGGTLVSFEDVGEPRCLTRTTAVDIRTGARRWTSDVYHGRPSQTECAYLPSRFGEHSLLGVGSRFMTRTATGMPQLFDLSTGRAVWTGTKRGVAVDLDQRSVLVRTEAERGPLTLLDLGSGRVRWSMPDPGISVVGFQWRTTVSARRVAVSALLDRTDARVLVYDAGSGRRIASIPGELVGAGDDWLVVQRYDVQKKRFQLELIRL